MGDLNQAAESHGVEKDIAECIKKEFDKNHGPTWHCIVGRNFGNSFVAIFLMINKSSISAGWNF